MLGLTPRMNTVFRSRWKALWWSAGVLVTAYSCTPSAEETVRQQQEQAAKQAETKAAKNPWALDK